VLAIERGGDQTLSSDTFTPAPRLPAAPGAPADAPGAGRHYPRRVPDAVVDRAVDALSHLGPAHARAMFGGWGVYVDGAMVGLIAGDVLYLKVDAECEDAFAAAGLEPFRYTRRGRAVAMSYRRAPEPLEDWDALAPFAAPALAAAHRALARRRARSSR
jgi:DNA transformation protein